MYEMGGAYLKCVDTVGSRRGREREEMEEGVPSWVGPPLFT